MDGIDLGTMGALATICDMADDVYSDLLDLEQLGMRLDIEQISMEAAKYRTALLEARRAYRAICDLITACQQRGSMNLQERAQTPTGNADLMTLSALASAWNVIDGVYLDLLDNEQTGASAEAREHKAALDAARRAHGAMGDLVMAYQRKSSTNPQERAQILAEDAAQMMDCELMDVSDMADDVYAYLRSIDQLGTSAEAMEYKVALEAARRARKAIVDLSKQQVNGLL